MPPSNETDSLFNEHQNGADLKGVVPKYFPEILLGFLVNIFATFCYENFKLRLNTYTLLGSIIVGVTIVQILLLRHVYRKGMRQLRDEKEALRVLFEKRRQRRSEILHNFIHHARDLGVRLLPANRQAGRIPDDAIVGKHLDEIRNLLEQIVTLFRDLAPPNCKVWAALRVREANGDFRTLLRTADCNPNRGSSTTSLGENSRIVQALLDAYRNHDCVILTGPGKPEWEALENDKFGENKCVLLGAVFSKYFVSGNARFSDPVLTWMLCVNSDRDDAFTEGHKNLMRCCNDALSWIVNQLCRMNTDTAVRARR